MHRSNKITNSLNEIRWKEKQNKLLEVLDLYVLTLLLHVSYPKTPKHEKIDLMISLKP